MYNKAVDEHRLTKSDLKKLKPVEELELLPLEVESLLVSPYDGSTLILVSDGKRFAHQLNPFEGTSFVFAKSEFSNKAHIKDIYQIYLHTMNEMGFNLEMVVFEAMHGDVMYCQLRWSTRRHRRFYAVCSAGDAVVLATIADVPMAIVRNVLDKLESCENWPYENDIFEED